ncbi:MAG: ATP-binding protein [Anaerolineales bacterium]|nr:MAG: ATP-binding protein [Anaerolineales bacterium]
MSIRLKVILPYLLLTVVVAVIGVYVVTRLVANSMSDRLTNQLLEAGRVVSDSFVRLESNHINLARGVVYYEGIARAVIDENGDEAYLLAGSTLLGEGGAQNLILISPRGTEMLQIYVDENGEVKRVGQDAGSANLPIVVPLLNSRDVDEPPLRALGINLVNGETYYYTSLPLRSGDRFAGVVVVGTSMRSFQSFLKSIVLADIIIYGGNGQAIATTLGTTGSETLQAVSISEDDYREILLAEDVVTGKNLELDGRNYTLAYGPLQVGNDRIGVYAVVLPSDYVLQSGEESRSTYINLFATVMLIVIAIGFLVSRMITRPLYSLVTTSQAIAGGDLEQRTNIRAKDEIGELAATFDNMTGKLQERTHELEQINERLRRIDKTKTNFIQISAHELRTPLTVIMGYSQMLEQDTQDNPGLLKLVRGILEGSERMSGIVDSMLDVSRIDNKALVLRKTSVRMDLIIGKVSKGFAEALNERNIQLDTNGLEELPPVFADPDLIQKVFYHLVMNAIKFTPDGGSVTVSGRHLNGDAVPQVEMTVSDTGIGIDASSLPLIFERFSQTGEVLLHSSGKTKFKGGGPGLGLAIARGIVEAHGGRIRAESPGYNEETNPGSTFVVTLPVEKAPETES